MKVNFWNFFIHLEFSLCYVNYEVYYKFSIYDADWSQKTLKFSDFLVTDHQENKDVLNS